MQDIYTKAALTSFLDFAVQKGLVNTNTGTGWKVACGRILEDVADDQDVRGFDIPTAIRRYNNKHPGVLSPSSLKEYERRIGRILHEFVSYVDNPTGYKPRGKSPTNSGSKDSAPKGQAKKGARKRPEIKAGLEVTPMLALPAPTIRTGLTLEYPLRSDFLAQIVIPRDMKSDEARRLAAFVMTLATDFSPRE